MSVGSTAWLSPTPYPGVPVQFRVLAFRGGVSSEPSNTAVVYDDEAPVTLLEAA